MRKETNTIRKQILTDTLIKRNEPFFYGADVAVTTDATVIPKDYSTPLIVTTQFARELSDLFYSLRDLNLKCIDYLTKYEFYGRLGARANSHIQKNGDNNMKALLLEVLDEADLLIEELSCKFYFAYGSNMDKEQMSSRCPGASIVGVGYIENYRFALDSSGVATVVPSEGERVEGVVWEITEDNENSLDRYEGVRSGCYRKEHITVSVDSRFITALIYISNRTLGDNFGRPGYMERIHQAAISFRLSDEYIEKMHRYS